MEPSATDEVLIRREGRAGRITMNRPKALNALTYPMVGRIWQALLAWQSLQSGRSGQGRRIVLLAFGAYLAQAGVGALFVLTQAGRIWGAAHVGLAAATWALLVTLSVMEYLQTSRQDTMAWQSQSKTAPN